MIEDGIGVDLSKAHLDAFRPSDGASARFANGPAGFRAFRRWLGAACPARVVYEPTGPYHAAFEARFAGELPLVKVNPLQARRFAEAKGVRAKTDRVDARMLAGMGAAFALEPDRPVSQTGRDLKELHVERRALVAQAGDLRTRLKTLALPLTRTLVRRRLALVLRQLAALDGEIARLIEADAALARNHRILCSIPGIGAVSAAAVLTHLPEIGTMERKACASLAGLAPMTRMSGQWQGKAHIGGGRKPLRDALYMPALVAIRHNPGLRAAYEALRGRGKPAKLALVAVMRALLETANALVRANRIWTPMPP